MTNLISGKEAKLAWANGVDVEFRILSSVNHREWKDIYDAANGFSIQEFDADGIEFRLKPRTITLNGIEVPAPFEPKVGEKYWFIADYTSHGYSDTQEGTGINSSIGKWKSEDEVKQVVAALRQVFDLSDDAVNAARGGK